MSAHSVNIIQIEAVRPHVNADRLEIVPIGGWQAVIKKGQFQPGDAAIYIEPDYTVPTTRSEFSFLAKDGKDRHRLKAVRLRGVLSYGLLIPVPEELKSCSVGDDVMAKLGIERYEPPVKLVGSDALPFEECPNIFSVKFDVESLARYPNMISLGETVIVTEKIHGANARYLFLNGVFYMSSRTQWLKPNVNREWKRAADNEPRIRQWCEAHPGVVLYGEVYGSVQSLKYGAKSGEVRFVGFAALSNGEWWDQLRLIESLGNLGAPVIYHGSYIPDVVKILAEQDSTIPGAEPGHMREGIVIVPERERRDETIGRVALKHVSNRYWESAA